MGPNATLIPSTASMNAWTRWGDVSKTFGQTKFIKCVNASSQPKPFTPNAMCLIAAHAVCRWTKSLKKIYKSKRQKFSLIQNLELQWGSEYQTSSVFKWSKRSWMPNSSVFKCYYALFVLIYSKDPKTGHSKSGIIRKPDIVVVLFLNGRNCPVFEWSINPDRFIYKEKNAQ